MASAQTVPCKSITPTAKKDLKPVKTKLRLKKDDIRQCRLCMRILPREDTRETMVAGSDLRRKILDAVSVKITAGDKVKSICINCLLLVDIIHEFRMTCRKADTIHGTRLLMMHPGSWLSDENKATLQACHRLVKRNRAEMDALFKCSGMGSGEVHRLAEWKPVERESKEEPIAKTEEIVVVELESTEETAAKKTDDISDSDPEMSEQCGRELEAQVAEADRRILARKEANMCMCEICGKFMQKSYVEHHMNTHVGSRPYECPVEGCKKTFNSNLVKKQHMNYFHAVHIKRYECETCHKRIKGLLQFNQHLKTHEPNNPLKVPCNVCGKTFYKRYLKDHLFVHTGELPYKCEFCGRKFAARNNCAVHMRKQHADRLENH